MPGNIWHQWTSGQWLAVVLGVLCAAVTIILLIVSRTRWGRAKPLTKFSVISVVLHVWLLMYALGTRPLLPQGDRHGTERQVSIAVEFVPPDHPASDTAPEDEEAEVGETSMEAKAAAHAVVEDDDDGNSAPPPEALPIPELLDVPIAAPPVPRPTDPGDPSSEDEKPLETAADPSEFPQAVPQDHDGGSEVAVAVAAERELAVLPPTIDLAPDLQDVSEVAAPIDPVLPPVSDSEPSMVMPPRNDGPLEAFPAERDGEQLSPAIATTPPAGTSVPQPPDPFPQGSHRWPQVSTARLQSIPHPYRLRQSPQRWQVAQAYGADEDSEAAVAAALRWLAENQSADGSWVAAEHGGGTETFAYGEHRYGTGKYADTGVTGLALLAFLGAGHTHQVGDYAATVRRGLEYLLAAQMPSGDLSGPKQIGRAPVVLNARMYCHGIATLALAEAFALSGDAAILPALRRACDYTVRAQDARGGGWRYMPGDPGDLSQFGWQAMALVSAEGNGVVIPGPTRAGMLRFLESCMTGSHGGLARYRPREGRPTPTMTAEALVCHVMMRKPMNTAAREEAVRMILAHLPGQSEDNVYFWYYATVGLFQLQEPSWRQWNAALKPHLVRTQVHTGAAAGSWEPDGLWGGYGGRVYSTAMCCMCLEVYYRYLPMYGYAVMAADPHADQPRAPR
ncbi:MAG: squalene--hopene cyclase [Pirellulaceae bacterium]|nr:MAG: squalene--hopene cyclase [Pirellulaceae bacterium]